MAGTFSASVDAWAQKSQKRMEAIFREATQRTVAIMQDRVPVDTGFCRASLRASLESMPQIDRSATKPKGGSFTYNPAEVTLVIAGAQLNQTIYIGYTASYAGILEGGSSKQAPSGFVGLAAEQWQATVNEVVADAKSRVG